MDPVLGGRRVRPRIVVGVLLVPIVILIYANAISAVTWLGLLERPQTGSEEDGWGVWGAGIVFAVWLPALTITTLDYHRRTR